MCGDVQSAVCGDVQSAVCGDVQCAVCGDVQRVGLLLMFFPLSFW